MRKSAALAMVLAFGLGGCASIDIFASSHSKPAASLLYAEFQDHAVLQRDQPIAVWGTAQAGSRITIALAGEGAQATADASGNWRATLAPLKAGGPFELSARTDSGGYQVVKDVLIGDVYLCSGQSNMEMPVRVASNYDVDINGAANSNLRLMHVERFASALPRETFGAAVHWDTVSPTTVRDFSAACYYFGRELQPAVDIPIGLIEASWGGSSIDAWLGGDTLRGLGGYEAQLAVMAHYVSDPAKSIREWRDVSNVWWHAHDPGSSASPAWSDPAFDDASWSQIIPAGDWEGWGIKALRDFDGIVWFRIHATLSAAQAKGDAVLTLGPVDDVDSTWINGVAVGATEGWDTPRVYTVAAGTLHEGDNLIAVGVLDMGAGGGMWGPASDKTLKFADGSTIKLDTPWRYRISAPLTQTGDIPHAPWLSESGLSMLYNGMIEPLGSVGLRGIIWYQGESNTDRGQAYGRILSALIADWRARLGAHLPFLVVQLPNYGPPSAKPEESQWAQLRESERQVALNVPNTGLVTTIDLGQSDNIHPTDKQAVGARLALLARQMIYGEDVVGSGPAPRAAVRINDKVTIQFDGVAKGLVAFGSERPIGFEICDAARRCDYADATLTADAVTLDLSNRRDAAYVRFCWADSPFCNLYNSADLPAVPFELPIVEGPPAAGHRPRHVNRP